MALAEALDATLLTRDARLRRVRGLGFTDVHEPVFHGPDTTTAYDAVLRFRHAKDLLADLDAATTEHALQRLRATVAAHDTGNGVLFDSRAWIVTAVRQRRGGPAGARCRR